MSSNFYYTDNQNLTAICTNQTLLAQCDTLQINNYTIYQPELAPPCIIALILGLHFSMKIYESGFKNRIMYSITFAMIGIMMTDACIAHCFLSGHNTSHPSTLQILVSLIDVGLTSSIGLAFFFDGLCDLGLLDDTKPSTIGIFGLGAGSIFCAWYYVFYHPSTLHTEILYMGIVGVGCGGWILIQIILMISHKNCKGLIYLILAGVVGAIGFLPLLSYSINTSLCEEFGCHMSVGLIWFVVTDIDLWLIYLFYITRNDAQGKLVTERIGLLQKSSNNYQGFNLEMNAQNYVRPLIFVNYPANQRLAYPLSSYYMR